MIANRRARNCSFWEDVGGADEAAAALEREDAWPGGE
jgi:hypothetical protein